MSLKKALFIFKYFTFIILFPFYLLAQDIPLGTWRNHSAFLPAKGLTISNESVYCFSDNGLFYIDKSDNSLNKLSKLDGLSEAIVQTAAYDSRSQTLVVAYDNANIDLIKSDEIIELPLIKNSSISFKKPNHLYFSGDFGYLSADFGVVVLDMLRGQIRETYQNLGLNGSNLIINGATISQDSLVLATNQGVIIGALKDNLLDFNNWKRFNLANGLPTQNTSHIISRNQNIYALVTGIGLYKYNHQNQWVFIPIPFSPLQNLHISQNIITLGSNSRLIQIAENETISSITNNLLVNPQTALFDTQNTLWIADRQNGLLKVNGNNFQAISPNGPARAESWSMAYLNQQIFGLSGGFDANYNPMNRNAGFYQFSGNNWSSFNQAIQANFPLARDLVDIAQNPVDKTLYLASFNDGILQVNEAGVFSLINQNSPNTTLQAEGNGRLRVSSVAVTRDGDLWLSQFVNQGQNSVHLRRANGTWQSFAPINAAARSPQEILIARDGVKWLRLSPNRGGGIWVLDNENNRGRYLNNNGNEGNLPAINVNAMVQDLEGQIWVGTDRGIAVFTNPSRVFEGNVNAFTPIFESRPLLRAEVVTALAVDGGNRKWVGTRTGLWLFSADGSQLIHYFNETNSPLISNQILSIAIDARSGEVFIATDKGIISYRGTATAGNADFSNFKVFPNPVRPDFTGLVSIGGLAEGANVKITDASGRLFFETKAQGGSVGWNLRDYQGAKAQTGIYLIFCTNTDGTETFVGKLAVVE
jgi:hypothetical protein